MRRSRSVIPLCSLFAAPAITLASAVSAAAGGEFPHHDLEVVLEPGTHRITVEDRLTPPADGGDGGGGAPRFALHRSLRVEVVSEGVKLERIRGGADLRRYGINEEAPGEPGVRVREYRLVPREPGATLPAEIVLRYRGKIHHPLVREGEEYARSFSRTPGIIDDEGVVLSGSTFWLPALGDALVTFRLAVELPEGWDAVSQGRRAEHELRDGRRRVVWDSPEPMDEIYLVAARFTEYSRAAGDVTAYAFLRQPDPNLAAKYLEATAQYVEMYRRLIGPYPYGKFALVENFWDTGYGMPSFTLLGPRIIRFPFILHSSYPHEILHNWWGNSVFVDYERGNWCEGLTAYLADHLVQEGRGRGAAYRRDTLRKYRSFVRDAADFPLTEFRSRHSSATEAVGYGKSLMVWHMLRRRLGDEAFAAGLARVYREHRFRRASWTDFEAAFSQEAGEDLAPFFEQWVARPGAPELQLGRVATRAETGPERLVSVELLQVQPGEPFRLSVPVAVTVEGEDEPRHHTIEIDGPRAVLEVELPAPPARIDVDPEFDLFRRLSPYETAPSIGQLFGAERVLLVLPEVDDAVPEAWSAFAESWRKDDPETLSVLPESGLARIPDDAAVWVLGSGNRWSAEVLRAVEALGGAAEDDAIVLAGERLPRAGHAFAMVGRHPADTDLALGWIGADRPPALPGLARKLPHYGKYSYVAFTGDEPTNVVKGQWQISESPMTLIAAEPAAALVLPAREPLARPAPVFDPQRMLRHVRQLAAPEMEGRGAGSAGLDRAGETIAAAFAAAGLQPGGDAGGFFQSWTEAGGPDGAEVTLRNVIGVLPGTDPARKGQSVVLGAHYDHLGRGWPDVRDAHRGETYPGADDNASGVAVLLELAALLARELKPSRSVVFVAFAGEEWELRGSRHYVRTMQAWPASKAIAMINLDTVGRLGDRPLTLFGAGSASEWVHIARGVGFTTGVESKALQDDPGGSDQRSFHEAGVPAVQVFTGAHADYHRPSDTADKIDAGGLVRVATFVREALVYLAEREEPLTSALAAKRDAPDSAARRGGRRVSLGTLPDFAFRGPGVRVEDVLAGTPAEAAGVQPGDVILALDGEEIADLRAYATALRARSPGDTITLRLKRGEEERTLEATLVAR